MSTHPKIARAEENLATEQARLAKLKRRIVEGGLIGPEQLTDAKARVEYGELLVERARREVAAENDSADRAAAVAERIRSEAAAAGDGPDLEELAERVTSAARALVAAADDRTDLVRRLASDVAPIDDHERYGLFLRNTTTGPQLVRTPDTVLVETPGDAVLAAALANVLDDGRPGSDADAAAWARRGVAACARVGEELDRGPYTGELLSAGERAEQWRADRLRRREVAGVEAEQRKAEEIERARREGVS